MTKSRFSCLATVSLLIGLVSAEPINCKKATTVNEHAICTDPELLQADARMSTLYDYARSFVMMGERCQLEADQQLFLKARRACGSQKHCVAKAYTDRTAAFQAIMDRAAAHGPF